MGLFVGIQRSRRVDQSYKTRPSPQLEHGILYHVTSRHVMPFGRGHAMLQLSFVMHYPALHCIVKGSCRMLSSWGRRVRDSKGVDPWHIAIADDSHKSTADVLLYAATLLPCQGTQVAWRSWACGRNRCAEPCAIYRQTAMDDKSGRFYGPIKGASLTEPNRTESTKSTEADSRCWDSARLDSTGM